MLSWSLPWLLLALPPVALWIRWLHRHGPLGPERTVPALFVWPTETRSRDERATRPSPPDPRWRLRAAVASLLLVSLAGPQLAQQASPALDLFFDDSVTLATAEPDGLRTDLAIAQIARAFQAREPAFASIHIVSIRHPQRSLALDRTTVSPAALQATLAAWIALAPRDEVSIEALRGRPDAEHWLVTDGADERLLDRAARAGVHRILLVGRETENAAVTRLAVRAALDPDAALEGIAQVHHTGTRPARRRLRVVHADEVIVDRSLDLEPGAREQLGFRLPPHATGPLRAELDSADALAEDDLLVLDAPTPTPVATALDPRCGRHLRAAITAHPALRIEDRTEPELIVWCSPGPAPFGGAVLRAPAGRTAIDPIDFARRAEQTLGAGRMERSVRVERPGRDELTSVRIAAFALPELAAPPPAASEAPADPLMATLLALAMGLLAIDLQRTWRKP